MKTFEGEKSQFLGKLQKFSIQCSNYCIENCLCRRWYHQCKGVHSLYRIVQNFGGVKLWRIDRFRVLARKMLANLQQLMLAALVNLEFGWVKYWRMTFVLPNSPKFAPPKFCAIWYSYVVRLCYHETFLPQNLSCMWQWNYSQLIVSILIMSNSSRYSHNRNWNAYCNPSVFKFKNKTLNSYPILEQGRTVFSLPNQC